MDGGGQDGAAGIDGGAPAPVQGLRQQVFVSPEQHPAGFPVFMQREGVLFQLLRDVEAVLGHYLVARGFFGVGGQASVFQGVGGDAGYVFDCQADYGVFGYGGVAVADYPAFMEVRCGRFAYLPGRFVEGFGTAGGQ